MRLAAVTALSVMLIGGAAAVVGQGAPGNAQVSRAEKSTVQFLFPEQISVEAGKPATADLHFRVAPGFHINSHAPHSKTLIPTNLIAIEEPGVKVTAVDFPAGHDYSFSFSPEEKVSVYSDEFVLRAHLTVQSGEHLLQGGLRYQACDSNSCYPPKTIPMAVDVIAK